MNAILNIHRLGSLINKEIREKYPQILRLVTISICCYLIFWLMTLLMVANPTINSRGSIISAIFMVMTYLAPFILYKRENQHSGGIFYAISPVSTLEKTVSLFLICTIITPAAVFISLHALDSLLTLFPFEARGFHGNVWESIKDITHIHLGDSTEKIISIPNAYTGILLTQGILVFLCMLFRRNKIGYSLLLNAGAGILAMIGSVVYLSYGLSSGWDSESFAQDRIINLVNFYIVACNYALPAICWILTYIRIKRIQY